MRQTVVLLMFAELLMACKKPYTPPASNSSLNYLVVEGVINPGADSTIIKLSRSVNLSSKVALNPLAGAVVAVQSDQQTSFPLTDEGNGTYVSAGLNLDNGHQYRLSIKTPDGRQYLSDLAPVTITPAIDSIGFNIVTAPDTGVVVYANSHDATNNTHYYRWDYTENWEFHAKLVSNYITNGDSLIRRPPDKQISICFNNDISSDIVLGSSAKLSKDIIYQNPIVFMKYNSERIEARYSIFLREYALTGDAYNFWVSLRKNTEQLGSIFDAQPTQLKGNIHCITNPSEPVIGYLSVSTVSTKRGFVYASQLPAWIPLYPYVCTQDTAKVGSSRYYNLVHFPDFYLATDTCVIPFQPAFFETSRECADCTIRGTKIPPPFWR